MKKLLHVAVLLFIGQNIAAQGCSELFISEYCEGSGNNKAVEIFNPTDAPINLSGYAVERWSNGANQADEGSLMLQGTIPAYGTWVVVNGQTTDEVLSGGGVSPACDPQLQILGNQLDSPYPAPTYMNGNDAIILSNNGIPVDIFGKPGEDPGQAWTNNADANYTDADGGAWLTRNKTLIRKFDVQSGVTTPPVVFNTFLEWDSLPSNTWSYLGEHACSCDPNDVPDDIPGNISEQLIEFEMFPNPTTNGVFNVESNIGIEKVEVFTQQGRLVETFHSSYPAGRNSFDVSNYEGGVYLINVYLTGNRTFSQRLLIK